METISRFSGDYAFLSNFCSSLIVMDNQQYSTVEHAYQAAKTTDMALRAEFTAPLVFLSSRKAKRMGRLLPLRPDWEAIKDSVMLELLRAKFQLPYLRASLLRTGDAYLVEGNTWGDTYWGVCNGVGLNKLGILLMQVRDEIRG